MLRVNSYASSSAPSSGDSQTTPPTSGSNEVTKNMFLQLLVAQLRNQDPMHPSDGTQFVAPLAQFQQLEQAVNMGQDISTIRQDLDQLVAQGSSGAVTQS